MLTNSRFEQVTPERQLEPRAAAAWEIATGTTNARHIPTRWSIRYRHAAACPVALDAEREFARRVVRSLREHRQLAIATFAALVAELRDERRAA